MAGRTIKRWLSFAIAAMLIAAAFWGAGLTQRWFVAVDAPVGAEQASSVASATLRPPAADRGVIEEPAGHDAVLPPSPQRLFLVATSPGRNIGEGTAQIGTDPKRPQTYMAGGFLANGARLAEIHRSHVLLERDGKKFELHIAAERGQASDLATLGGPKPPPAEQVTTVDDRLSGVIRSMPLYDGHALVGLQVFAGQKSGVFQQLGLLGGDVIVALDGAPVADANDSLDMLRTLADGVAMTATVRRQNITTTITLNGALLAANSAPPMKTPMEPQ